MEYICNLCKKNLFNEYLTLNGRNIVKCANCGLVSYFPILTDEEISDLYNNHGYEKNAYFISDKEFKTNHYAHFVASLDYIDKRSGCAGKKILEIGPGLGEFIELCMKKNMDIEAIELSSEIRENLAKKFNIKVMDKSLEDLEIPENSYDAVAAFDLIEHCQDPYSFLTKLNRILKPGGFFIMSTMNINNLLDVFGRFLYKIGYKKPAERLYPLFHQYFFTDKTLTGFLIENGFKILKNTPENYTISKAARTIPEKLALGAIYLLHNITGHKTNQYIIAEKVPHQA